MKLTTKLISLITCAFIVLMIIDSLFLINREEELIEIERLKCQFEIIETFRSELLENILPEKFTIVDISQLDATKKLFQKHSPAKMDFWVLKKNNFITIRFLSSDGKKLIEFIDRIDNTQTFGEIYKRTAVIILITLIISTAITYLIGISVVGKPVQKILQKIDKIKSREYEYQLEANGKDELATISNSLNEMAFEIENAYERIENESNEKLEYLKQLRHADRLTTIGALTSGIAHELGTPLNVILGHCSIIRSHSSDEKIDNGLKVIHKQVDKMSALIKNLLSFSQKSLLKKTKNDLNDIVNNSIELLSHKIKQKDIRLTYKSQTDAFVDCDKQKLEQVFINIIMNAIHALEPRGQIKILLSHEVEKTYKQKTSNYHMVCISDNGPGIERANINKIFDPFFTTRDIGQGTGLGLSISVGIIEEHEGWIEVDSVPGEGAIFYVYLPSYKGKSS